MANTVVWTGLDELKASLLQLPDALSVEASRIVEGSANGAVVAIRTIYGRHVVSGRLQKSVAVHHRKAGRYSPAVYVKATSPIAWLFDNGSQARHWASGKSTGTMWGKTPPTHAFVKTMIAERQRMYRDLKDLLTRHGAKVSGDAR